MCEAISGPPRESREANRVGKEAAAPYSPLAACGKGRATVRLSDVLGPAFYDLARDVFRHGHTHYDLAGGRGSLKSSTVSLLAPLLFKETKAHTIIVLEAFVFKWRSRKEKKADDILAEANENFREVADEIREKTGFHTTGFRNERSAKG